MLKTFDSEERFSEVTHDLAQYVLSRDENLCGLCGGGGHQIHHIKFRSQQGGHYANNLILLCRKCHAKVHRSAKKVYEVALHRIVLMRDRRFRSRIV